MLSGLDAVEVLTRAALVGATAVGLTLVVRKLPPVSGWVTRQLKPWACNLCCATWATLGLSMVLSVLDGSVWAMGSWLPALAVATWGLNQAAPPDFELPQPETDPSPDDIRGPEVP
ncbi:MAG: hypothetical protein AB8I08_32990 [Sandaracinaceae bacterium]